MPARIRLLEVPYDSGCRDVRHGAGPPALVAAGAAQRLAHHGAVVDHGRVQLAAGPGPVVEAAAGTEVMRLVAQDVAAHAGHLPVVLAGNCGVTLGVVAGLRALAPERRVAVLWLDAHGDLQTPATSASGFFDGMSLAMTTGRCWQGLAASVPGYAPSPDDRTVLVGGHQLDEAERRLLDGPGPTWLTVADVRAGRAGSVLDGVLAHADAVHVHVDLDVHDTSLPPANSYAAPGGLTPDEVRATVLEAVTRLPLASATVASWDPTHDVDDRMRDAALGLLELLGTLAPAL
ncbi:arginase family protein [Cellulomonas xiejunii]|uniref:Arginase family protein n=1 Tax=Cellulomonas xiejunii TaxID=2968083 RepID=A0ABY5KNL1_9CELL|nr:arginase family protein [Cellulomonas xiejunii]MCC2321361.1 arginase family protein [Cellulomonas xiejunii]UUI71945.1 arginase family protein [Cellulomonas xiejunii]